MAKKRAAKGSLKKLPAKSYCIAWNKGHTTCVFEDGKGRGGESCMGVSDVPIAFTTGKRAVLLSLNYMEGYACLECFEDGEGASALCFADPKDCEKLFGADLSAVAPKKVAERLLREC